MWERATIWEILAKRKIKNTPPIKKKRSEDGDD